MNFSRRLGILLLASGCMLVACGGSVSAQETGSLVRPAPVDVAENARHNKSAARGTMYAFADCALKRNRANALLYAATFPDSQDANRRARNLASDRCLGDGEITFNEPVFRGALYQAFYRQTFAFKPVSDLSDRGEVDYAFGGNPLNRSDLQVVALRQYADCVARGSPATVHKLVLAAAGSAAEVAAFDAIRPNLSACLPKGQKLAFSRISLRGVLGEVLYRIRMAQPLTKLNK